MKNWIFPLYNEVKYGKHVINNSPINFNFVFTFDKFNYKHYPDNTGLPSIKFWTVNHNGGSTSYLLS